MKRRATFTLYVAIPDNWSADQLEVTTSVLMASLATADVNTLEAKWSCPELGRGATPPALVLAFDRNRRESCETGLSEA